MVSAIPAAALRRSSAPILVVEDNAEDLMALRRAFRKHAVPNPVVHCATGEQALEYLVKQQFDQAMLHKTVMHAIEKNEWRQYVGRYHGQLRTVNQQLRESLHELTASRQEVHDKNMHLHAANHEIGVRNQQLAHSSPRCPTCAAPCARCCSTCSAIR